MRRGWAAVIAVLAIVLAGPVAIASATAPISLGSSFVADDVGALSAGELSGADATLAQLEEDTGISLYVALVSDFTDPADRVDWANTVANENGLGDRQYLLAIATEGRQYTISASDAGPLTDSQLDSIEQSLVPQLRDSDWAGAIDTAAQGVRDATGGGGGGFLTVLIWIVVIAAAVGVVIWLVVRSRRKARAAASGPALEQLPLEELAQQAGSALIETDDAVKTSVQELSFARAQFGDEATTEFSQAIAEAKKSLDEAFTLNQQLADSTPDSEADARAWNTRIIELCRAASALLDQKVQAFDELRDLEKNAPEALARVQELRAAVAPRIDEADAALAALGRKYAATALTTIADNPAQARQRLAFADEQLTEAQADLGAGRGGEAAVGIRAAEEAVDQADLLSAAVTKVGEDLAKAESSITALVAELRQDLATAGALPDASGRLAPVIAATQQAVDSASAASGDHLAPLQVLERLEAADTQIDEVIAGVRDQQAAAERAKQQVGRVIMQGQAQVSAAEDYITARRGAVGADARTRLAQAGAALVQAQQLQTSDPAAALTHAQQANALAGQAIQLAQRDVGGFQSGGMGGMFGGGSTGAGGNVLGAVLGGIVINSLLGGSGGSRRSGGLGGMFGGGGRSSGGWGGGPGSFGGGGTRSRRGGGRF